MISEVTCCVAGCTNVGSHADEKGNLYCNQHWLVANACTTCSGCGTPVKCSVAGCSEEGIITQDRTGNHYCVKHAWKSDRVDAHGLPHPNQAQWSNDDIIRAHGLGIKIETGV